MAGSLFVHKSGLRENVISTCCILFIDGLVDQRVFLHLEPFTIKISPVFTPVKEVITKAVCCPVILLRCVKMVRRRIGHPYDLPLVGGFGLGSRLFAAHGVYALNSGHFAKLSFAFAPGNVKEQ